MPPPTPTQDRLARGKPTPTPTPASRSKTDLAPHTAAEAAPPIEHKKKTSEELFAERDGRDAAARVVGSWELLAMWASARVESIPQTRRRFEKMMMGLVEEKSEKDDWEDCFDEEGEGESEWNGKRDSRSVRRGEGRRQRKG